MALGSDYAFGHWPSVLALGNGEWPLVVTTLLVLLAFSFSPKVMVNGPW